MNRRKTELLIVDTCIIIIAYYIVGVLSNFSPSSLISNGDFTLLKLCALYISFMIGRIIIQTYTNIWRYANVKTYLQLMASDIVAGFVFILLGRLDNHLNLGLAYDLLVVMAVIIITLTSRYIYQLFYVRLNSNVDKLFISGVSHPIHKIDVAIVGAGSIGVLLAAEFARNPKSHYEPYCFIDKDAVKYGQRVNGLKVYPADEKIIDRIKQMPVQEIIIALPDLTTEQKNELFELYKRTDCKVKLYDYPLGNYSAPAAKRRLREFKIEDLLFRESVKIINPKTASFYEGKTVLVTGGGGSIGSELCRQIAKQNPEKLVILDIYENNAYEIQQELIRQYGAALNLEVVIASVRDVDRLDDIFNEVRPDLVFHAAAHKHVPLMEHSGVEALKNNVLGTYNVANLAEKYGVKKFLLISTDKAVNPTNIMGASKRLCEMVIQCRYNSKTEFTAVRFGNVLGSNGSVIPLFKKQIENGGPITITDKRIIRYFMTIPEAVQLVMETCVMAHNGELFVLDMGKPVKILDLAINMILLSGLTPYDDIDIVEIGLRPGEKLYEELLMRTKDSF